MSFGTKMKMYGHLHAVYVCAVLLKDNYHSNTVNAIINEDITVQLGGLFFHKSAVTV